MPQLLCTMELAAWLNCSKDHLYALVARGMPHVRLGTGRKARCRFSRKAVEGGWTGVGLSMPCPSRGGYAGLPVLTTCSGKGSTSDDARTRPEWEMHPGGERTEERGLRKQRVQHDVGADSWR